MAIPNKPGKGGVKMAAAVKAMVGTVTCGKICYDGLRRMKQKNSNNSTQRSDGLFL